jgi:hypothetical protein
VSKSLAKVKLQKSRQNAVNSGVRNEKILRKILLITKRYSQTAG